MSKVRLEKKKSSRRRNEGGHFKKNKQTRLFETLEVAPLKSLEVDVPHQDGHAGIIAALVDLGPGVLDHHLLLVGQRARLLQGLLHHSSSSSLHPLHLGARRAQLCTAEHVHKGEAQTTPSIIIMIIIQEQTSVLLWLLELLLLLLLLLGDGENSSRCVPSGGACGCV